MKTLAIYALEVLACSGVLLAAYAILLERRVKFRWCRLYLLATTAVAALIPLLRIPVWPGRIIVATPTVTAPAPGDWTAEVLPDAEAHAITPGHLCLGLYLAGASPDPRHHVVAGIPYPAPPARRGGHPYGQIQDRAHAAGDRFVLVFPHNLHLDRNTRSGDGGDPGP